MDQSGLQGAHVALVTPLTPERRIHDHDVARLVARAADDGLTGVLVAGTTGEGALLEPAERVHLTRVARAAVDAADRRVVLLAGAIGNTTAALHEDVASLTDAGADAVLVLAPSLYPLEPTELVKLHLDVADRAVVPTLVYHLPQMTGSALTVDAVRELAAHPRIVGLKDSSRDDERRLAFVAAARELDAFEVFTGSASSLHATLAAGGAGSMTAVANLRARSVVALHAAVAAGNAAEAEHRQEELTRLSAALKRSGGSTPASIKAALQLDGAIEERWCRAPLASLAPDRLDHVRSAMLA